MKKGLYLFKHEKLPTAIGEYSTLLNKVVANNTIDRPSVCVHLDESKNEYRTQYLNPDIEYDYITKYIFRTDIDENGNPCVWVKFEAINENLINKNGIVCLETFSLANKKKLNTTIMSVYQTDNIHGAIVLKTQNNKKTYYYLDDIKINEWYKLIIESSTWSKYYTRRFSRIKENVSDWVYHDVYINIRPRIAFYDIRDNYITPYMFKNRPDFKQLKIQGEFFND